MDIKLKNSKTKGILYVFFTAVETIAVSALAVFASIYVALGNMYWAKEIEPEPDYWAYSGTVTDQSRFDYLQSISGILSIALLVIAAGLLIALVLLTGRGRTDDEGNIPVNWFDRIWSEAQIILGCLTGTWFASIIAVMHDIWMSGAYLKVWESTTPEEMLFYSRGVVPETVEILYCSLGRVYHHAVSAVPDQKDQGASVLGKIRSGRSLPGDIQKF